MHPACIQHASSMHAACIQHACRPRPQQIAGQRARLPTARERAAEAESLRGDKLACADKRASADKHRRCLCAQRATTSAVGRPRPRTMCCRETKATHQIAGLRALSLWQVVNEVMKMLRDSELAVRFQAAVSLRHLIYDSDIGAPRASVLPMIQAVRRPPRLMMAVLMAAGPGMSSATLTQRTATTMRGQMAAWCVGATLRPGGGSCVTSDALVACALCHASPPSPHPSPQGAAADGGSGAPSAPKKARGSKTKLTSDEIAARKAENELRHSAAPQVSAMLSHRATPPPIPPHATPRCAFNHSAAYVCLSGHLTDVAAMDLLLPGN